VCLLNFTEHPVTPAAGEGSPDRRLHGRLTATALCAEPVEEWRGSGHTQLFGTGTWCGRSRLSRCCRLRARMPTVSTDRTLWAGRSEIAPSMSANANSSSRFSRRSSALKSGGGEGIHRQSSAVSTRDTFWRRVKCVNGREPKPCKKGCPSSSSACRPAARSITAIGVLLGP
jgi:hypothetical protein